MSLNLEVLGDRVLIKPKDLVRKIGSIEIAYGADEKAHKMACQEGTVASIGPEAWNEYKEPWAKVGDKVIFAQYAGKFIEDPVTKEVYVVINDIDLQVIVRD